MKRFTLPHDLYFGAGSVEKLSELKGERAVLVVPKNSINHFAYVNTAKGFLENANFEVMIVEDIENNRSSESIFEIAISIQDFKPDLLVAIGDGSVIDTSKGIWFFYENSTVTVEDMNKSTFKPNLNKKSRFIAIPTTLSTSMELSAFSINTSIDLEIVPDIVILDSELITAMSKEMLAYTGMNALSHAIESLTSTEWNDFIEPYSMNAIRMLYKYLYQAYNGDQRAIEKVHYAQYQSGMAFSNTSSGLISSITHQIATIFSDYDISIGLINAVCLPHIIKFNSKVELSAIAYTEVAKIVGLDSFTTDVAVDSLIKSVLDCNEFLDIPSCLKDCNNPIPEKLFLDNLENITNLALEDNCTKTAPRRPSFDELSQIIKACYYGEVCDI